MNTTLRLALLLLLGLPSAGQTAQPTAKPAPLTIADQGYFFVAGQYAAAKDGQIMTGQMYVQYQIPQQRKHRYPVVMWHGGGQTGTNFLGTPDGRMGWADYFVRQGYAVYVVDQPGRARSGYFHRYVRTDAPAQRNRDVRALHRTRAGEALSAGSAAYPMAGQRRRRRSDV